MAGTVRTFEPDFSGGPTADDPLPVTLGVPELEIDAVDGGIFYRWSLQGEPWKELDENTVFRSRDGSHFSTLYLHSEGDTTAQLQLTVRKDFCREVRTEAIVEVEPTAVAPERLAGSLAPGSALGAGAELSERVDVAAVTDLDLRARVSGVSGLARRTTIGTQATPSSVAIAESTDHAFVVGGAELRVYDITDPDNPTQVGTLDYSTAGPGIGDSYGLAYLPTRDVVVTVGEDSNANNTAHAVVLDVSTRSTPVVGGTVQLANFSQFIGSANVAPYDAENAVNVGMVSYQDGWLGAVAVDAAGVPTVADAYYTSVTMGLDFDPATGVLWAQTGNMGNLEQNLRKIDASDPTAWRTILSVRTSEDIDYNWTGVAHDPGAGFVLVGVDGNLELYGTDAGAPVFLDTAPAAQATEILALPADGVVFVAQNTDPLLVFRYDEGELVQLASSTQPPREADCIAWYETVPRLLATDLSGNLLEVFEWGAGAAQLLAAVQRPDGTFTAEGMPAPTTLPDEAEELASLSLVGIEALQVTVAGDPNIAGQVDFVDLYRRKG